MAEAQSKWVDGMSSRTRLIAGAIPRSEAGGPRRILAGVEITMPEGWKTYWRSPGDDGGIPPDFDFSKSQNVKSAKVLYPAPQRLADKSGEVIGYDADVIFPVEVEPLDPLLPVTLALSANYGVCKNICVPVEAAISLELPLELAEPQSGLLASLQLVPNSGDAAAGGAPTLAQWQVDLSGKEPAITLTIAGGGSSADAFLESIDGSYIPQARIVSRDGDTIQLKSELKNGADIAALTGKPVRVTLVGETGSAEIEKPLK